MKSSAKARFKGLSPASPAATKAAKGASRKRDTKCEVVLRRALYRLGLRYRVAPTDLPGRPDIVFRRQRVAVFCDGDFWHGRDLEIRLAKLAVGHNAPYWVAKIRGNVERDRKHNAALELAGWAVLRFWETDIVANPEWVANVIEKQVRAREKNQA